MFTDKFGLKKTDLHLAGISMGFASTGKAVSYPDGESLSKSSRERPEVFLLLSDGGTLHCVANGSKDVKLTIVEAGDSVGPGPMELGWVGIKTMEDAVESGVIHVGGRTLSLIATRSLKRFVAKINQ